MYRFLKFVLPLAAFLVPATSWATTSTSGNLAINVTPAPTTDPNQTIESVQLSGSRVQFAASGPYYVGTLTTNLNPQTPTFNNLSGASYQLVASGGSCSGGDTSHFQISGDGVYTNTLAAGTYTVCITASATGVTPYTATFTGIIEGNKINAAASYCAANGGGDGTSASPWHAACLQAAVNAAVNGDTIYLAGGNWALDTGDAAPVTVSKAINLVGAGSGNAFDVWGHVNNANGTNQCPTAGTSITCVYTTGTSYPFGAAPSPAGFISFVSCAGDTVAHIFFDGSQATDGGGNYGLLNFQNCAGPITVSDIRVLAFTDNTISAETQFWMFQSNNYTIQNSVFADPLRPGGGYTNSQTLQANGIGSNVIIKNNVFYQGGFNPIYLSNVTFTGNQQYDYDDGLGDTAITPALGATGAPPGGPSSIYCPEAGTTVTGQCSGDAHFYVTNNLFYAPGHFFGTGGGVNDPGTSGGFGDLNWTGNRIIADDGEIDACEWGECPSGVVGMTLNAAVDVNCAQSHNGSYGFNVTNNSITATTKAALNEKGNATANIGCKLGNPFLGSYSTIPIMVYGFNGQYNYLSSPSNQYLTNANTISPIQQNNYCAGSGGAGTVTGCVTSGFTTAPTCSFTPGLLTYDPTQGALVVPFNSVGFTAQYGAVQWLASTSSTTALSSDSRWSSNNGSFPNSAPNSYIPPVELSGVAHGQTVYMWVMDAAQNISSACSVLIP